MMAFFIEYRKAKMLLIFRKAAYESCAFLSEFIASSGSAYEDLYLVKYGVKNVMVGV